MTGLNLFGNPEVVANNFVHLTSLIYEYCSNCLYHQLDLPKTNGSQSGTNNCFQPSLDTIVTNYLREQHAHCRNPVTTCPEFSLRRYFFFSILHFYFYFSFLFFSFQFSFLCCHHSFRLLFSVKLCTSNALSFLLV